MPVAAALNLVYNLLYATAAYVVPGYQTFKAIEQKGSDGVREWGVYWVVLSSLYVLQGFIDFILCWLPLYYVLKLAFIVALWYPRSQLASVIYGKAISPMLASYEADIDKLAAEARTKLGDLISQHSAELKTRARQLSGNASVALKNVQNKVLERAHATAAKGHATDATHGLHTE